MKYLLAVLPSIVIGLLIYKSDRVEKEPKWELFKSFMFGVFSIIVTLVFSYSIGVQNIKFDSSNFTELFVYSFIDIALIEELSKWLFVVFLIRRNKEYNYYFDGIVYSSFLALGFATVENLLYATSNTIDVIIFRAITTVPAHVFFAVSMGIYMSKLKKSGSTKSLFLSLFVPVFLHGLYDFCLLSQSNLLYCFYFTFVVGLYVVCISKIKYLTENDSELPDENEL